MGSGQLRRAGNYGYSWSKVASSKYPSGENVSSAYDIVFLAMDVYSSDGPVNRRNGLPLRRLKRKTLSCDRVLRYTNRGELC